MGKVSGYKMVITEDSVVALFDKVNGVGCQWLIKGKMYPVKKIIDTTEKSQDRFVVEDDGHVIHDLQSLLDSHLVRRK